jgi:hypothetical protein
VENSLAEKGALLSTAAVLSSKNSLRNRLLHNGLLVVVDANYVLSPDFQLRRTLQHALTRGRDSVCFTKELQDDLCSRHSIVLGSPPFNPQILAMSCQPFGALFAYRAHGI